MRKAVIKMLNLSAGRIVDKYKPVVIGVFGDGKEGEYCMMIKKALEGKFDVYMSGSISKADTGVAFALVDFMFKRSKELPNVIILRMDARRTLDIKKMLEAVRPDFVVFADVHVPADENLPGRKMRQELREKSLLFRSLRKDDMAVFGADDGAIKELAEKARCRKITFGFDAKAEVRGEMFHVEGSSAKSGTSFKIAYQGTIVPFHFSGEGGENRVRAALAAAAVALELGLNLVEISESLRL